MGRTNPTFRDVLGRIEERWRDYRRTLRRRDQPRFDRLFAYAREHADAAGTLNAGDRLAPVLFSIDVEQEARLDGLDERIEVLESRLDGLDERLGDLEARLDGLDAEPNAPADRLESPEDRTGGTDS
jgi:hypothetical protein